MSSSLRGLSPLPLWGSGVGTVAFQWPASPIVSALVVGVILTVDVPKSVCVAFFWWQRFITVFCFVLALCCHMIQWWAPPSLLPWLWIAKGQRSVHFHRISIPCCCCLHALAGILFHPCIAVELSAGLIITWSMYAAKLGTLSGWHVHHYQLCCSLVPKLQYSRLWGPSSCPFPYCFSLLSLWPILGNSSHMATHSPPPIFSLLFCALPVESMIPIPLVSLPWHSGTSFMCDRYWGYWVWLAASMNVIESDLVIIPCSSFNEKIVMSWVVYMMVDAGSIPLLCHHSLWCWLLS